MPRLNVRNKMLPTLSNNNAGEETEPKKRNMFHKPLPKRPTVVGRALVCGMGDMGQLGLGDDEAKFERKRPALVESIQKVVDVRAGGMHSLVLTYDGDIFSFGCNDEGALGRDSSADGSEFEPHKIQLPSKVLKISAGDSHSACLLDDGNVFAWGSFRDSHGNMGLTLDGNKREPINVLPKEQCCDIASGSDHLVILTCTGKVFTTGCGEQGQLGRVTMRSASGESRRGKTELLAALRVNILRAKPIDAIWATNYCTFLRESQTQKIYSFGLNNYKQLAYARNVPVVQTPVWTPQFNNVKQISGGQHHTLILKNDGTCHVIGRRDYGRLGLGALPEDVTEFQRVQKLGNSKIVMVSCGEAQSFALSADGKLFSWGMGSNHQLGTGSEDDALYPTHIVSKQTEGKSIICCSSGGQHSIFLVEDEIQPMQDEQDPTIDEMNGIPTTSAGAAKKRDSKIKETPLAVAVVAPVKVAPVAAVEASVKPVAAVSPSAAAPKVKTALKRKNATSTTTSGAVNDIDAVDGESPAKKKNNTGAGSGSKRRAKKDNATTVAQDNGMENDQDDGVANTSANIAGAAKGTKNMNQIDSRAGPRRGRSK